MKNLFVFVLMAGLLSSCYRSKEADIVIHNARIYSLDKGNTVYEAVAIKDGKIIELGPEREIMNKYSAKREIDAMGKAIYPGFHDSHCHVYGYVWDSFFADLRWVKSKKEVFKRTLEIEPLDGWIIGRGWDESLWADPTLPSLALLDSLFPNNPAILTRIDGHGALINSKAFAMLDSADFKKILPGQIQYDRGEFTGFIMDNALDVFTEKMPGVSDEKFTKRFEEFQDELFGYGITSINEAGLEPQQLEFYKRMEKNGILKLDVFAMIYGTEEGLKYAIDNGKYNSDRINISSFKIMSDGSLGSRGACMIHSYSDFDTHGQLILDSTFQKVLQFAINNEFQVNAHCIGDSANRYVLNSYGEYLGGLNDNRWKIEHAQVMNPDDFKLFSKFSVIPSVQPNHAMDDMRWAEKRIGSERLNSGAYAYKKLYTTSGSIVIGTDFPVTDINPIYNFFCSVFRQNEEFVPKDGFLTHNALSRMETLKGMTYWGAFGNFEEAKKGSIEEGKQADLIMINVDLLKAPKEAIIKAYVELTVKNGEVVYE